MSTSRPAPSGPHLIDALWRIFLRPGIKQSSAHFLHPMKLPLQRGGVATTAGALPGVTFAPGFGQMIADFRQRLLAPALAGATL